MIHGWVLWAAWGLLGLVLLLSSRYLKTFRFAIYIHIIAGMLVLIATLFMSFLALRKAEWEISGDPHDILGVIILASSVFITLTGFMARYRVLKKLPINWLHRMSGFVMIILGQVTILTGVMSYSNNFSGQSTPIGIVHVAIFYGLWLIIEIIHQIRLRMLAKSVAGDDHSEQEERIYSMEEFNLLIAKGRQLVILDDLILDIKNYIHNHPGGQKVLQANIGRDISKYFYGGYQYENLKGSNDLHTHSKTALAICKDMIVGII